MGELKHYTISKWQDLTICESNTIPGAYIHVSAFGNQPMLIGKRITVHEPHFGVLYSALVEGIEGSWIVKQAVTGDSEEILGRLQQLGFDVHWSDNPILSQETMDFLWNYMNLGYTDIMKLYVRNRRVIIAFDNNRWTPEEVRLQELHSTAVILNDARNFTDTDFSWLRTGIPVSIAPLITNPNLQEP